MRIYKVNGFLNYQSGDAILHRMNPISKLLALIGLSLLLGAQPARF